MRLLSFSMPGLQSPRIGIELRLEFAGGSVVVPVQEGYVHALGPTMGYPMASRLAAALMPDDMRQVLAGGEDTMRALRTVHRYAADQLTRPADLSSWRKQGLALLPEALTWLPPVPDPGKILAVGSNYGGASAERGTPVVFAKMPSCLVGDGAVVTNTAGVDDLDFEGELTVVIGRAGYQIKTEEALAHVAGYTIVNDLTRRALLADERSRGAILFGKNFPGAAPCGPVLVTVDEIPDPQDLDVAVTRNGELDSAAHTSEMTHTVAELVGICSQIPLEPGDLIMTGAPKRPVGARVAPLADGDLLSVRIPPVGELSVTISWPAADRPAVPVQTTPRFKGAAAPLKGTTP